MIKVTVFEFSYFDNVMKPHIRKNISIMSENICSLLEIFGFSNNRYSSHREIIERIGRKAKSHPSSILRNFQHTRIDEVISQLKLHYVTIMYNFKTLTNSFFTCSDNYSKYNRVFNDLLNDFEETSLENLGKLIINHFLFSKMNPKESNVDIDNNVSDYAPFLPEKSEDKQYTLVLDLDETLIHYFTTLMGGTYFVRPGAHEFLKNLSRLYEIVIFTAATKEYADDILNQFDEGRAISFRLYRNHTESVYGATLKDLNKLGRELTKTIIIDNIGNNFRNLPNNGLECKTWEGEIFDTQLYDLMNILVFIAENNVEDVTDTIRKIHEQVKEKYNEYINPYAKIELTSLQ